MLYASELSSEYEIKAAAYNNRKVVFAVLNFFKFQMSDKLNILLLSLLTLLVL